MCPYPIYIHKHQMDVPCGKCGYCLRRRINDWVIRCKQEMRVSPYSYFITLTYKQMPEDGELKKSDLQKFFKRCRKYGLQFRYLAIGDYGDTYGRPHYHVLYFSSQPVDTDLVHSLWASSRHQENGFVTVDKISVHRIRYVVEYGMLARLDWHKSDRRVPPFFVMSKRPAIGANYLSKKMVTYHRHIEPMHVDGSFKYGLPRYYRKKIFNYNSKTGTGFRYQGLTDIVLETERQVKAIAPYHPNPDQYLYERRKRSADSYLQQLRERKKRKNKNYE